MGEFRRRIIIESRIAGARGEARAVLEDDFHHFRVALQHQEGRIARVDGDAPRHPYSACPAAIGELPLLVGTRLDAVASAVTRATDASGQCTHLLDLAGLAIAAAVRGEGRRQYDIDVPDRVDGRTRARLRRDGQLVLWWDVEHDRIVGPDDWAGVSLREGFARRALATGSIDDSEAAIVLRRGAAISIGRKFELDLQVHARETGLCFAQQPARATQALRMVGSTLDFSARETALCASDACWLGFDAQAGRAASPTRERSPGSPSPTPPDRAGSRAGPA